MHPPQTLPASPPVPRALRVLRVLFSLVATFSALGFVLAVLGVIARVTQPDAFGEPELSLAEEVFFTVGSAVWAALYGAAAVLLGRGGSVGRRWALAAIGFDAAYTVGNAVLIGFEEPLAWAGGLVVLALPGLFLLLLSIRSSREWFRATAV